MPGGVILLAAGASRRFGADKRKHLLAGGLPMLHATAEKYLACFEQVVVVLRPGDEGLEAALLERFAAQAPRVVFAAQAELGMGHSLAAGIAAAADWAYAFIALADMPFVEVATLRELDRIMQAAGPDAIVQPSFEGNPGHPVGFGRGHFAELAAMSGDAGARSLVKHAGAEVLAVPVADRGVLRDVDQPTDLGA